MRRLREEAGLTCDDVGEHLECSASKISRIETGRRGAGTGDVRDLLDLYGVTDEAMCSALVTLARQAKRKGWWHSYADVLSSEYSTYIDLEAEAASVRNYESLFVPGLLQTEEYARAVISGSVPESTSEQVERLVKVRMTRQPLLTREESPVRLWAIVDEAVLHRQVGGPEVMSRQLRHLAELAALPHVTLQVVPWGSGAHPGMAGTFSILEFPEPTDQGVVYVDGIAGELYLERPPEIRRCGILFDHLRATALSREQSRTLTATVAGEA